MRHVYRCYWTDVSDAIDIEAVDQSDAASQAARQMGWPMLAITTRYVKTIHGKGNDGTNTADRVREFFARVSRAQRASR